MGTSSGFGRSMTEYALNQGDIIVATLRKPQALSDLAARYPADKLLVLKVDVMKQEDINEAFARTSLTFGRLDAVFNNAGYGFVTEVESTPADKACEIFETNFWGVANVSRTAVKFFREVNEPGKGGIILQNSSVTGFYAPPGMALEGFSDKKKICIIEPGAFQTEGNKGPVILPQHPAYTDESFATSVLRQEMKNAVFKGDPEKFTRTVDEVVRGGKIPKRLPMGLDALEILNFRIDGLKATVNETKEWSVDLKSG
ncbi:NAD(P)-binding protein [Suillus decipiens]|nr:NAD(P)-binding protein [Suillus decipiens]